MQMKGCCKLFLLTVLHLLHTVIDGEVLQSCAACGMDFLTVLLVGVILMELHRHKVDGCCHPRNVVERKIMLCQELLDVLLYHVVGYVQNLDAHVCAIHYDNLHNPVCLRVLH